MVEGKGEYPFVHGFNELSEKSWVMDCLFILFNSLNFYSLSHPFNRLLEFYFSCVCVFTFVWMHVHKRVWRFKVAVQYLSTALHFVYWGKGLPGSQSWTILASLASQLPLRNLTPCSTQSLPPKGWIRGGPGGLPHSPSFYVGAGYLNSI